MTEAIPRRWFHFRLSTTVLIVVLAAMSLVAAREHYLKTRLMHALGAQVRMTDEALQSAQAAIRPIP
jgi:hypothetical protein